MTSAGTWASPGSGISLWPIGLQSNANQSYLYNPPAKHLQQWTKELVAEPDHRFCPALLSTRRALTPTRCLRRRPLPAAAGRPVIVFVCFWRKSA